MKSMSITVKQKKFYYFDILSFIKISTKVTVSNSLSSSKNKVPVNC